MIYAIYRLSDGVVVKHIACPPRHLARNIPDGCAAIEGEIDPLTRRVDVATKTVVDWQSPDKKDSELVAYELEQQLARETLAAIEAGQVRTIREALLGDAVAIERLRGQEPAIAAARAVLQRPRPSAKTSGLAPPASVEPPAE